MPILLFKATKTVRVRSSNRTTKTGRLAPVRAYEQKRYTKAEQELWEWQKKELQAEAVREAEDQKRTTDTPCSEDFDYIDGPIWNGKVILSGLSKDFPKLLYEKWTDMTGQGPCGVLSEINRRDRGLAVASCGARTKGTPFEAAGWFPHYVNFDKRTGAIIDETNPFGRPLQYRSVFLLPEKELPEMVDDELIKKMRLLTGR